MSHKWPIHSSFKSHFLIKQHLLMASSGISLNIQINIGVVRWTEKVI